MTTASMLEPVSRYGPCIRFFPQGPLTPKEYATLIAAPMLRCAPLRERSRAQNDRPNRALGLAIDTP